jgi:adenylate cyclase
MDLVLSYKGSVNKIIGDALLATFGCPVRGKNDARNAVECALAIRDTLRFFNDTKPAYLTTDISIGMGIATGPVFAGTIGSYRKMEYTVIGDTVNVASRLETLTKQTRFDLIVDSKTRELAGPDLLVKKLQVTRVRGRTKPMEIFLVEGFEDRARSGSGEVFF